MNRDEQGVSIIAFSSDELEVQLLLERKEILGAIVSVSMSLAMKNITYQNSYDTQCRCDRLTLYHFSLSNCDLAMRLGQ